MANRQSGSYIPAISGEHFLHQYSTELHFGLYSVNTRYNLEELKAIEELHVNGKVISLDALYVDTTFLSSNFPEFPTQRESIDAILEFIESERDKNVFVFRPPSGYSHNQLYTEVAKKFGKIHVCGRNSEVIIEDPELRSNFCIDECKCDEKHLVHLCPPCPPYDNDPYQCYGIEDIACTPDIENICIIRPTACRWTNWKNGSEITYKFQNWSGRTKFCYVAYSSHCSNSELKEFIAYLKPGSVHPNVIPWVNKRREDMQAELVKILEEYQPKRDCMQQLKRTASTDITELTGYFPQIKKKI